MKANELMIGDWVYVKHYDDNVKPIKILNIYGNEVNCKTERNRFDVDEIVSGTYMIDLYPIPLTAEILEKNGFGYKEEDDYLTHYYLGDRWYLDNPDLHIGTNNKGVYWLNHWDNAIYGIKYVHQLQHALRLCNFEKKIEL